MKFNWRIRGTGALVAHLDVRHNVTAEVIAHALVHSYSQDAEVDELPHDLTKAQVVEFVRRKFYDMGDNWQECGVWNAVAACDEDGFRSWAGSTVRRLFPEVAASDPDFQRYFPEVSA